MTPAMDPKGDLPENYRIWDLSVNIKAMSEDVRAMSVIENFILTALLGQRGALEGGNKNHCVTAAERTQEGKHRSPR